MAGQSQGAQAQMCIDESSIDTNSQPLHFYQETLTAEHDLIDDGDQSMRGTRTHPEERVSEGLNPVEGSTWHYATPDELDALLPWALGAAENFDVFNVAETIPARNIAIDKVAKVFTFNNCYVKRMIITGQTGGLITFKFDIEALTVSEGNAGSFPALTHSTQRAYAFHEGVMTLFGSARKYNQFALVVDNHTEREFNNSKTATDIGSRDREIWLYTSTPYTSDETALYTTPAGSVAGAAATLVFTNGNLSTSIALGNLKAFAKVPTVAGKRQIRLPFRGKAFGDGATPDIKITHDSVA